MHSRPGARCFTQGEPLRYGHPENVRLVLLTLDCEDGHSLFLGHTEVSPVRTSNYTVAEVTVSFLRLFRLPSLGASLCHHRTFLFPSAHVHTDVPILPGPVPLDSPSFSDLSLQT